MSILGSFPLTSTANTDSSSESDPDMEEVGERFTLCYKDLINDLASFQNDPSQERADERKETFTSFAQDLMERYETFADGLRNKLDKVTSPLN
jgi:hypothetical protein